MGKYVRVATMFCILIMAMTVSLNVQAEERVGFSVQAELPENQLDDALSYFDLRVEPDQEQILEITIFNHENEELTINGAVFNASTNSNGLIVYEESDVDSSLNNPVTELVTLEDEEWIIPAGESITVNAALSMPEDSFEGIKLGGLYFEKSLDEGAEDEGVNIHNQYAYVIGVQLSENDVEVAPELALNEVTPELVNYRTAVTADVQNTTPVIVEDIAVEARVYSGEDDAPIHEVEQEGIRMAPNSTMPFVIEWDNAPLEAGDYRVEMTATDGEQEWEWQETFQISEEDESLNEEAVELEAEDGNTVWYASGMVILVVIILGLVLYIRRLKQEK